MKFTILLALLVLAACVAPDPIVSDYNGASVKVVTFAFSSTEPTPEAAAEALRICRAGGASTAEYASTRMGPNYEAEHLYLCL